MDDDKNIQKPSVCHIDVIFPVTSDEQAIEVKHCISEALKDIDKKRFTFQIIDP